MNRLWISIESGFIEQQIHRYCNFMAAVCQILPHSLISLAKANTGSFILVLMENSSTSDITYHTEWLQRVKEAKTLSWEAGRKADNQWGWGHKPAGGLWGAAAAAVESAGYRIGVSYRVESRDKGQDHIQLNSDGWTGRQADSLSKSSQQ